MFTYTAHRLSSRHNLLFPIRLGIDAFNVTYYKGNIIGYQSTSIERKNIASVKIASRIFFADIVIETIGGKIVIASGFLKWDATTIIKLLSVKENVMPFGVDEKDYYSGYNAYSFQNIGDLQSQITKFSVHPDLLNAAIFWFTNMERRKHNLKQFQNHKKLIQSATLHSEQMKIHDFFSHDNAFDARYATLVNRIDSVIDNSFQGFMCCGENIADYPNIKANERFTIENRNGMQRLFSTFGKEILPYSYQEYAKIVVEGWMNSPGHRANILHPDFEYLGCGCAMYEKPRIGYSMLYFKLTQNFGGGEFGR